MIFSEVKNITISQGDIKKISLVDGTILYEYTESLVCNPVVGISLSRGTSSGSPRIKATGTLSGISNSLITSIRLLYVLKGRLGSRPLTVSHPTATKVNFGNGTNSDTVNGAEFRYNMAYKTTSMVYVFRFSVTYKNLSGSTVTKYSDQVEASYNSLA